MVVPKSWRLRKIGAIAAGVAVFVAIALAVISGVNQQSMPDVPLPEGAENVFVSYGPLSFYKEISFGTSPSYPNAWVIEFYAAWAQENGWYRIGRDTEHWSTEGWETFVDDARGGWFVDQYLAHWATNDDRWSLRVAVFHSRPDSGIEEPYERVGLWLERFNLVRRSESQKRRLWAR